MTGINAQNKSNLIDNPQYKSLISPFKENPKTEKKEIKVPETQKDDIKLNILHKKNTGALASLSFIDTQKEQSTAIDSKEVFHNSNVATASDIDKILKHFNSPHAGKGKEVIELCKKYNINPIMMISIAKAESSLGSKINNPKLKQENMANPWSVHFSPGAKGIKKLRLKTGELPTFEQSLEGAIHTLLKHAGDSEHPLTQAGKKYCEKPIEWTKNVIKNYKTMVNL